jgi:hypothetical protein
MSKTAPEIEKDIRAAVERCGFMARGFWHEMRYVIETFSNSPGELRRGQVPVSVEQLADEVRCPATKAQSLADKLRKVHLIDQTSNGVWYSARLARIHQVKKGQAARKAKSAGKRTRKGRRVLPHTQEGVTSTEGNTQVARDHPPPALSLSPHPSLTPTHSPSVSFGNGVPAAAVANPGAKAAGRRKGKPERALTDEQVSIRDEFTRWFCDEAYPRRCDGVLYDFAGQGGRNAKAVLEIMRHPSVAWDLAKAKMAATAFLGVDDLYIRNRDFKLWDLADKVGRFLRNGASNGHRKPAAVAHRGLDEGLKLRSEVG